MWCFEFLITYYLLYFTKMVLMVVILLVESNLGNPEMATFKLLNKKKIFEKIL